MRNVTSHCLQHFCDEDRLRNWKWCSHTQEWLYDIRGAGLDDFILPDMYYVYYYYASELTE